VRTKFVWDPKKAASNLAKHKVSFEQAAEVFDDPAALYELDVQHGEQRDVVIGMSAAAGVLFVVSIERDDGRTIRIISARRATKRERVTYERES
jgi:hypothetical protein